MLLMHVLDKYDIALGEKYFPQIDKPWPESQQWIDKKCLYVISSALNEKPNWDDIICTWEG